MGYLTTIVIHNDALHCFEQNPKEFAEAIFDGINVANRNRKESSVGFKGYANYINIHPSRHADDEQLYVHTGNTVFNINPYSDDWKTLLKKNPQCAESFLKSAELMIKRAKKDLKELKTNS